MPLSPINRRRLANFRRSKRGYRAFWIFLLLFGLSLPAEFLANDKPVAISYQGHLYFPVLKFYPETAFGGDLEAEPDYRDRFIIDKIEANGWMLMPPLRYDYRTIDFSTQRAPSPPSAQHWLGLDDQGRDVLARLIYGFRLSVLFALILSTIAR